MQVEATALPEVLLITPTRIGDHRGWFSEVYRQDLHAKALGGAAFVQDNQSYSRKRGTLRGLHYQENPHAQGKLVRVLRGAVLDVVVDARHGSPTFARHVAVELSAENGRQIWVPRGFLHGFCALTDDVEMLYKVDSRFSALHDKGVAWNDPDIGVDWPTFADGYTLSARDEAAPRLRDIDTGFRYEGR
jgi:dTDP-4-dehydrorhamnose 3,5-epimerase